MSYDGFQLGSNITTLFAEVRLRPKPPARVEMRKTNVSFVLLNLLHSSKRTAGGVLRAAKCVIYECLFRYTSRHAFKEAVIVTPAVKTLVCMPLGNKQLLEDIQHTDRVREEQHFVALRIPRALHEFANVSSALSKF